MCWIHNPAEGNLEGKKIIINMSEKKERGGKEWMRLERMHLWGYYLKHPYKNRAIIRALSLCHFDFLLLNSTGNLYRLSLIRIISLNQYMPHNGSTIGWELGCVMAIVKGISLKNVIIFFCSVFFVALAWLRCLWLNK